MAESETGHQGGRRVTHRRYARRATVTALLAAGRGERVSAHRVQTYTPVPDTWTDWVAVSDDDPRLNTVEHLYD